MKRPGGVTPPSVPETPVPDRSGSGAPATSRSSKSARELRPAKESPAARSRRGSERQSSQEGAGGDAVTEPIAVVGAAPDGSTVPLSRLAPLPPLPVVPDEADGTDAQDAQARSLDGTDTEPKPWWLSRRTDPAVGESVEAQKSLVQAEKSRRRYERAEARRFTQSTRTRRKRVLIGLASAVVLVLLVVLTAYSPLLAVRTITVEGASRVDASAVSAALDGQLGRPLTLVDFDEVKTTLSAFPLIQSYVTEAQPPNTLVVRIIERRPVVTIASNGAFELVDAAGVVVETSPARAAGYPTVDVQATPVDSPGFSAVGQVLLALSPEFLAQVDSVGAATPDSVTLVLANGQRVVWGSAEDSSLKARILAGMISNPGIPDVSEFDVSSPEAPITK